MQAQRMSRRIGRVLAAASLVVATATGSVAAVQDELSVTGVDIADHPAISITVTAPTALAGRDVPADAFEVVEAGLRRDVVVERLPSDDLDVVLAIDTSGSMVGAPLAAAKRAATTFVETVPAGVRVAIVGFGSQAATAVGFTTDRAALISAIEGLRSAGETALHDALVTSAGLFPEGDTSRAFVVLLSDGGETASQTSAAQATSALQARGATVEVVALETAESDLAALSQFAQATDGHLVTTSDPAGLESLYAGIAGQLVNRYELRWRSAANGATQVVIHLEHEGVQATARQVLALPAVGAVGVDQAPVTGRRVTAPGWLANVWTLRLASASVLVGSLWLVLLLQPRRSRGQLAASGARPRWIDRVPLLGSATDQALQVANRHLDRGARRSSLDATLERAGVTLRPAEYIVMVASGTILVFLAAFLAWGLAAAIVLGMAVGFGVRAALGIKAQRRLAAFTEQLPDTLQVLAGALRAGHGLVQSIDAVSRQAEEPTAGEFHRVLTEVRLGRDLDRALDSLAARINVDDLEWVVQAMQIHREVGGDLAEVLETVAGTVRERAELRGQIKALTAQGRLSAVIMFILPFFMAAAISVVKPGYLAEFTTHPVGYLMLAGGAILMTVGALWTKRLIRLVF